MIHRAKRRDANEAAIVEALRAIGCYVQPLDQGGGVPDLLVGRHGVTLLIEVKNPESKGGAEPGEVRRKGRGRLMAPQVTWFAAWRGSSVIEVVSVEEAIAAVEAAAPGRAPVLYKPSEATHDEIERRVAGAGRSCHRPMPRAAAGSTCDATITPYNKAPERCGWAAFLRVGDSNLCRAHAWCRTCQEEMVAEPGAVNATPTDVNGAARR